MNYFSAENLSRSVAERWLFKGLNFGLSRGDKVALVGRNGTGKTTLLDTLAGVQTPDEGNVSFRKELRLGYLPQQPVLDPALTVLDTLFQADTPLMRAVRAYEHALTTGEELSEAIEEMEALSAWDFEARAKQILGKLGITEELFERTTGQLSGGQRKRVALARILLEDPDILLLDEPTNHLDLMAIEWLENYLASAAVTLLLVTHDRYFLDKVCKEIAELTDGQLHRHKGNYAYFLEKRQDRIAGQSAEIDKARNLFRRELDWMRRQPKARSTKAQYRVDAFEGIKEKASQTITNEQLELNVGMARLGSKIMEVEHLRKAFGNQVIVKDFTYTFRRKERIGIVGKNGVGKSTFLDMLTGTQNPDAGLRDVGQTVKFGYYTQAEPTFAPGQRVIDVVKEIAEVITLGTGETISVSQFLQQFLFEPKRQYTFVEQLSGGEKRRLQLLKVLVEQPNFLILDEPTNDLDLETLNVLEAYLMEFAGCVMLVSHDRYFMDRLVEHLFVFEGEGVIRDFGGNYTDYREAIDNPEPTESKKPEPPKQVVAQVVKRKLSFKEQKEYEQLEVEIAQLEDRKSTLTEALNTGNYQEISEKSAEIKAITEQITTKEMRWLELSELM